MQILIYTHTTQPEIIYKYLIKTYIELVVLDITLKKIQVLLSKILANFFGRL